MSAIAQVPILQHRSGSASEPRQPRSSEFEGRFIDRPDFYQSGSHYSPTTKWCDFAVDVSPKFAAVSLVVRRFDDAGNPRLVEIPMQKVDAAWSSWDAGNIAIAAPARWAISVCGVRPGEQYAYRIKGYDGSVIAEQASDPFAIASTPLVWKAEYVQRVQQALNGFRREGESDDQLLERVYAQTTSPVPAATPADFEPPWSIVIDHSQLLPPNQVAMPQPHKAGERVIIKYHPLHSVGVAHDYISEQFREMKGLVDILRDQRFISYLAKNGNAIEFFPLGHSVSDPCLLALGRENVWGYMPANPCGLDPKYFSASDPHKMIRTFQEIAFQLKQQGLSVICDIVSGHTAEAGAVGPAVSLRHLYPEAYFLLDARGNDVDVTGCHNTINPNSPLAIALLHHQSSFYVNILGVERRIDQAATLGIRNSVDERFDPEHPTFRDIVARSPDPIVELMLARRHYNRLVPTDVPGITSKIFLLRNWQYAVAFGELAMWPNSCPLDYRAFIASGSCGGVHPLQQLHPWPKNHGVQVFSHDGETVFDRARWMAVHTLRGTLTDDTRFQNLMRAIDQSPNNYEPLFRNGQLRYNLMLEAVAHLQQHHTEKFLNAQSAAARWFLTQLYTTPGDILIVAGDHMLRTQEGDPDAYDRPDYVRQAMAISQTPTKRENQQSTDLLTANLMRLRIRYPAIFKNRSIVNGQNTSSFEGGQVLSLKWIREDGEEMSGQDWGQRPAGEQFLGWIYAARAIQGREGAAPNAQIYVADSSRACTFTLPDPGLGHEWRVFVDSTWPQESDNSRYGQGYRYTLPTCGSVVFEAVVKS